MVTMNFRFLLLALSLVLVPFVAAQDDLELRVQVLEASVVLINNNVDNVETDVDGLESDVSQNTGQIFELGNDLDDVDDVNDLQEQRIGSLEEENSLLRLRLDAMEQLINSNTIGIQALNETVSDLDVDNSTNNRLDALESDVTTLEGDVTTLEGDVTTLEGDVTTLESDVTTLQGGFTQLENNVTSLETDLTVLDASTDQRLDDLEENNGGGGEDYSDTAFFATHSASIFFPTDPIVFDLPIINSGGHYNPESGIYTVPVDGIYQFVFHLMNYQDLSTIVYLEVDNVRVGYLSDDDDAYNTHSVEMTIMLSLTSGQQVWLTPYLTSYEIRGSSSNGAFSWISAHLIYPL